MQHTLKYTATAVQQLKQLHRDPAKKRVLKDVLKALRYMEADLRHPSLNTHQYYSLSGPNNEKVFEAYAQQATPGAYRIFWYYGPVKGVISIIAIIPHP